MPVLRSRTIIQTRAMATGVATIDIRKMVRKMPAAPNSRLKISCQADAQDAHWTPTPTT